MTTHLLDLLRERSGEQFDLHEQYLNGQMTRVLKTLGFDRNYVRARGPYLYDERGERYLDLLSGFGVFAVGRNHPTVVRTLREVLDAELAGLVQLDASLLAGILAERLVQTMPGELGKVFFTNSGAEAVESAIKFARCHTRRPGLVYCEGGFHGLTMGALALNGDEIFRSDFGPHLPGAHRVPFDDLAALERVLETESIAAFFVEPIQGHGVNVPSAEYLPEAARLCRKHGALFVADEIQTGLGRTGRMWAVEHWGVEPDMLLTAKALSGGFAPVGAVAMRRPIFDSLFSNLVRAPIHGSTFSKNNLAMAAGWATLEVIRAENLVENAAKLGEALLDDFRSMLGRYDYVHAVRGKGLMQAIEFSPPETVRAKMTWKALDSAQKGLFSQLVIVPLFHEHRILSQTASHHHAVVKFLPPLVIGEEDRAWIVRAVDQVVANTQKVGGAIWDLGKRLAGAAIRAKTGR
jgi:ornithine--oxo-acid transaminase